MGGVGIVKRAVALTFVAFLLAGTPAAMAASAPVATTGTAKAVTSTSATLTGTVNPEGQPTSYFFQYGTTTSYGNQTPTADAGSRHKDRSVEATISSLAPGTTYHFRLVALNASGTTDGQDQFFTTPTSPPPAGAPTVMTGPVQGPTSTTATLTGTVNPKGSPTTFYFVFGTTIFYGSETPATSAGFGTKDVPVSAPIGSLAPNTTYHYKLIAFNSHGTTVGQDAQFMTGPPSAGITIAAFRTSVTFGQATAMGGSVLPPFAAGAIVVLSRGTSAAGPFAGFAATIANATGAYSFVLVPSANAFYRASANGANSPTLFIGVGFRITLVVSNTHPRRGRLVRFHGRVGPRHNGLAVLIQRLGSDRRWHTVARTRLRRTRGNASVYSTLIRVRRSGRYRAIVGPDAGHLQGASGAVRIRVR